MPKIDREEMVRLHLTGLSTHTIAKEMGVNQKSIYNSLNTPTTRALIGQRQRAKSVRGMPPAPVVPPGFHLFGVSSHMKNGVLKDQYFKAKSGEEGDLLPESGTFPAPDGMFVRSTSTLVDGQTGATKLQWVKADIIKEQQVNSLIAAVKAAFSAEPKVARIKAPKICESDLLTIYPQGDPHIGLYAWAAETGTDFDLDIAERNLVEAMQRLVDASPASEQALIVNVGDFFHGDTSANRTLRSGHALDIDTRWAKVLRIGVRAQKACIDAALEKHKSVRVVNEIGNHDEHTSQMLTLALSMFYENNPRVVFDMSPAKFHYHRFGKNLIGITHGDMTKPDALGGVMATDQPEDWGATKFRYWLTGHVHNRRVFELPGCLVESFRTLAGKDSWTAASGYRAGRDAQSIVLHREFGERERHHIDISALEAK